jgi:type 1 glutamine amidotransferase
MTHPLNHNFPEQLRLWGVGNNQGKENVFLNFNPAQEQDWVLKPGNAYTLNYRMLVYDGEISAEQMEKYWQDYANPPKVSIVLRQPLNKKVLVYTKNGKGYVHDNIASSIEAIRKLGAAHGFSVDTSSNPALITPENLNQYQAIILSNTNNETFDTEAQKLAFQRYIQAGGGMVGIHSASGSERQWPWFWRTLGGKFRYHPPLQRFDIQVIDPLHPSTLNLPPVWTWEDECYYLEHLYPGKHVLLAARIHTLEDPKKSDYPGNTFGKLFPLCWSEEQGLGRSWYTALGHKKEYYSNPIFLNHLLGGILWVLDGSDKLDYSRATKTLITE